MKLRKALFVKDAAPASLVMRKQILVLALLIAVACCFGIGAIISTATAKQTTACSSTGCLPGEPYEYICCLEYVPINPNCKSPTKCPYEWVKSCWYEPCLFLE